MADAAQPLAARAAFALVTSLLERGEAAEALTVCDEALTRLGKDPAAPALLFRSAEAAQKLGQADAARARFLRVAEADPNDPWADDAALRAARLALEARDHAAARAVAATFATRFPKSPLRADARLIESRAALSANRPKDAIAILTASLAEDKPSPATEQVQRYYLGLAFRADGQSAKAAEILDALARSPSAPVAADAQYMIGQGHIEAGRFAEAIPPLEGYLAGKADGEVADYALAHLAQARVELGQADAASKALEELARRFPKSKALAPTRLRLAEAALKAGDRDRAAELFRLVIEGADPSLAARARSGLGFALLEGGKAEEAAGVFAALQQANPDDPLAPEAALARGRALDAAKKTDEALAAYAQVAEDYPKTEQAGLATLARARLLVDAGRPDDAAQAYARYVQDGPAPGANDQGAGLDAVLAEWGWALVDAGKAAEADKVFTRLLGEFPESPSAADARFNLAESAYQAKDYDEVLRLLAPLVAEGSKADPKLIQSALYRLGRTQVERKDWPGAAETFGRLLAEYPQGRFLREARFWRAEVALQAEDYKTAEADFAGPRDRARHPVRPQGAGRHGPSAAHPVPGRPRALAGCPDRRRGVEAGGARRFVQGRDGVFPGPGVAGPGPLRRGPRRLPGGHRRRQGGRPGRPRPADAGRDLLPSEGVSRGAPRIPEGRHPLRRPPMAGGRAPGGGESPRTARPMGRRRRDLSEAAVQVPRRPPRRRGHDPARRGVASARGTRPGPRTADVP